MKIRCHQCSRPAEKPTGEVNRARNAGLNLYCGRRCSGLARRRPKLPISERRAKKAAYDLARRHGPLRDEILAEKREYYQRTMTPAKARALRAKRKAKGYDHSAYCREYFAKRPARRRGKRLYDRARRYRLNYGQYRECARLLHLLQSEIRTRIPSYYERQKARGYFLAGRGAQERKRDANVSRW